MSVSDDPSYLSRFLLKFVEITAAGLATAVSGYLIAHLTGAFSSPAPAPATAVIRGTPDASTQSNRLAQPIPPISADVSERRVAHQQDVNTPPIAQPPPPQQEVNAPPVTQRASRSVNTAKTIPPHNHIETTTRASESKRDHGSFVARIRAALGSADQTGEVSRGPAAMASQPLPVMDPSGTVAAAPPVATEPRPVPVQQAPIEPNPPTAVEIKSRPVTSIQSSPAASPVKETDVLSPLEQILRHDPFAGSDDAPRPPMPVGE
jgi:hypothetical protein